VPKFVELVDLLVTLNAREAERVEHVLSGLLILLGLHSLVFRLLVSLLFGLIGTFGDRFWRENVRR